MATAPWQKPNPFKPKPKPKPESTSKPTSPPSGTLGSYITSHSNLYSPKIVADAKAGKYGNVSYGGGGGGSSSSKFESGGQSSTGTLNTQSKVNQAEALVRATNLTRQLKSGAITSEQFNKQMVGGGVITTNGKIITTEEVKRTGGGSYDRDTGRFSSAKQNVKKAEEYAKQILIQEKIKKLQTVKEQEQTFEQKPQSPFLDIGLGSLLGQQRTVAPPSAETIEVLRGEEGIKGGTKIIASGVAKHIPIVKDVGIFESAQPKISAETARLAYQGIKQKEVADAYLRNSNRFLLSQEQTISGKVNNLRNTPEYLGKINALQERVNAGEDVDKINKELEEYDKKNVRDVLDKELKEDYDVWFKEYSDGAGKEISSEALKDMIKFNQRYGRKRVSEQFNEIMKKAIPTGAVVGGGLTLVTGGLQIFGKVATATAVGAGATAVGAGLLGVYAVSSIVTRGKYEQELIDEYGFSKKEAFDLAKEDSAYRDLIMATNLLGFSVGAIATSTIISAGLNKIQTIRATSDITKFKRELINNPETTKKYYTSANLKRGYIIKDFRGVKVEFKITEKGYKNILAKRQGTIEVQASKEVGVNKNIEIISKLNKQGYNFDKTARISEINSRAIIRRTQEPVGRGVKYYMILSGGKQGASGFMFKQTSAGKIINVRPIQSALLPSGVTQIKTGKFGTVPGKERFGIFDVSTRVSAVKDINIFGQRTGKVSIKTAGKIKFTRAEIELAKLKLKGGKVEEPSIFFKKPWKFAYEPAKTKVVQKGVARKASVTKDIDFFGDLGKGKVSTDVFFQRTVTKAPRKSLFEFGKAPKPPKAPPTIPKTPPKPPAESFVFGDKKMQLISTQKTELSLLGDIAPPLGYKPSLKPGIQVKVTPSKPTGQFLVFGDMLKGSKEYQKAGSILGGLEGDKKISLGVIKKPGELEKEKPIVSGFLPTSGKLSSGILTEQIPQQEQEQIPIIVPELAPVVIPALTPPARPIRQPLFDITSPFIPFGFGLGGIRTGGGEKGKKKKKKPTGKVAYTPSLGAILLKQKKVKVTKRRAIALGRETFTGFEIRPELEITNKNKKSIFDINFK